MADTIYIKIGQKIWVTQPSVALVSWERFMVRQCINSGTLQGTHYTNVYSSALSRYPKGNTMISKRVSSSLVENLGETDSIIEYAGAKKDLCGSR